MLQLAAACRHTAEGTGDGPSSDEAASPRLQLTLWAVRLQRRHGHRLSTECYEAEQQLAEQLRRHAGGSTLGNARHAHGLDQSNCSSGTFGARSIMRPHTRPQNLRRVLIETTRSVRGSTRRSEEYLFCHGAG